MQRKDLESQSKQSTFDPSNSLVYQTAYYYVLFRSFKTLCDSYKKDQPLHNTGATAIFVFSTLPFFLPNQKWASYPIDAINVLRNPFAWIAQKTLALMSRTLLQKTWNKLSPSINNERLALEAAGVMQLGADRVVSSASKSISDWTDNTWSSFIWNTINSFKRQQQKRILAQNKTIHFQKIKI